MLHNKLNLHTKVKKYYITQLITCVPNCKLQLFTTKSNMFYLKIHTYKKKI